MQFWPLHEPSERGDKSQMRSGGAKATPRKRALRSYKVNMKPRQILLISYVLPLISRHTSSFIVNPGRDFTKLNSLMFNSPI